MHSSSTGQLLYAGGIISLLIAAQIAKPAISKQAGDQWTQPKRAESVLATSTECPPLRPEYLSEPAMPADTTLLSLLRVFHRAMQNGLDPYSFLHLLRVERAPSAPLRKIGKWALLYAQRFH
jgi:hypothetical protein